jgi:hypothetical protein
MLKKHGIFLMAITLTASSLFAGNLFSNSGFETNLTGWSVNLKDSSVAATIALDSVDVKFGKKYAKVTVTKVNDTAAIDPTKVNWYIQLLDPTWQAKKGIEYTYSCWVKADSAGRKMNIAAQGDSASEYTYRSSQECSLDTAWTKYSYAFVSDVAGTKKMHFFVYLGYSKGTYSFDSMALDSMTVASYVKNPVAFSNPIPTTTYNVQLLPNCMQVILGQSAATSNNIAVYSLEGRLISSYTIPSTTHVFEMPKPSSGTWVVGVNSNKKVIRVP